MISESLQHFRYNIAMFTLSKSDQAVGEVRFIELFGAWSQFVDDFSTYTAGIVGKRRISDKVVSDYLFKKTIDSKSSKYSDYLVYCAFVANEYLQNLSSKITKENIARYKTSLDEIHIDYEILIAKIEKAFRNVETDFTSFRKRNKEPRDILGVAYKLFSIEDYQKVESLYVYDFRPYSLFALRQCIEQYGKEILGYTSIVNQDGSFATKHLRSGWEFIKHECAKAKASARISIPFDIDNILAIEKWTNRFVHTTQSPECYKMWKAIELVKCLFIPSKTPIKDFTGHSSIKYDIAEIKITNYNSLKGDFEAYINSVQVSPRFFKSPRKWLVYKLTKKSKSHYSVNWVVAERVSSYILTL